MSFDSYSDEAFLDIGFIKGSDMNQKSARCE